MISKIPLHNYMLPGSYHIVKRIAPICIKCFLNYCNAEVIIEASYDYTV